MVKAPFFVSVLILTAHSSFAFGADIRFYKINKHEQTSKVWLSKKKTSQSGCHNFKRAPRVFTLVQTGFQSCSVYSEKSCDRASLVSAQQKNSDAYATTLSEGLSWKPATDANETQNTLSEKEIKRRAKGIKLRSWSCLDKTPTQQ